MALARAVFASCLFSAVALCANAADVEIHSEPATADNLRIYTGIDGTDVSLVLDGAAPTRIAGSSVMFARLGPGRHEAVVSWPDGNHASLVFHLSSDAMNRSKGRGWWRLMAGPIDGRLILLQPTKAQCQIITDAGPN
jgi:hypothetical protein